MKLITATTFAITMLNGSIKTPAFNSRGKESHTKALSIGNFDGLNKWGMSITADNAAMKEKNTAP